MATTMEEVCEAIHRDTSGIVDRWLEAAEEEPWFDLPVEKMIDDLPLVIRRLADVALRAPGDEDLRREKVLAAAQHGEQRRDQEMGTEAIFREYHFLRISLWEYLHDLVDDNETRLDAITRVDMAISIALRASLYGYHRPELEESGNWPERVERLADESPLLPESQTSPTIGAD